MTTICTGFSPAGYQEYGRTFLETFDRHWPKDVRLLCFTEEPVAVPRGGLRSLWACQGAKEFYEKYKDDRKVNGREPMPHWSLKDRTRGYSYRWDAFKFFKQCLIPATAADELLDGEVLAWMDADVVTHRDVPPDFVERMLGDADLCYLGRVDKHTELGFWAVRLNERTRGLLLNLATLYTGGFIFNLDEWHSAYAFDHSRALMNGVLKQKNLTTNGTRHVWFQCELGKYTDHLKGSVRKKLGRSLERV
jgi:hypothetical protein